jgi:hypothetical protein
MRNVICRSCLVGILAIAVLLTLPPPVQTQASGPVRVVTQNLGFNGGTTSPTDTTGANLLVACVSHWGYKEAPELSDSKGNSWTIAASSSGAIDGWIKLYYSVPTQVGSNHTFTLNGSESMPSISVMAWAGATASPLDGSSGRFAAGTSIQPGSVTPSEDNELLISCLTNTGDTSSSSRSINGGFTIAGQVGENADVPYSTSVASAYLVQTTAASANPTWSYSVDRWANAAIATFRTTEEGGGGGDLVAISSLNRVGAFRAPDPLAMHEPWTYNFGGLAYDDAANGALYANAGIYGYYIHHISIPTTLSTSLTFASLPQASYLQTSRPALEGRATELVPAGCGQPVVRGVYYVASASKLFLSGTCYYGATAFSHFTRSSNLSTTTLATGPSPVSSPLDSSFASGGMAAIPSEWQASFGGKDVLSGLGPASIISRTSIGPALFAWKSQDMIAGTPIARTNTAAGGTATTITLDAGASSVNDAYKNYVIVTTSGPASPQHRSILSYNGATKVATVEAWENGIPPTNATGYFITPNVPSTGLVYYPATHPTLGGYGANPCIAGSAYCTGDSIAGIAWLPGTRTIAVLGTHSPGIYTPCYGVGGPYTGSNPASSNYYERYGPSVDPNTGTATGSLIQDGDLDNAFVDGRWINTGVARCYDPLAVAKGEHNYPYRAWIYFYDANDLVKVYNGDINPSTGVAYKPWDIVPYAHGQLPDLEQAFPCDVASQCVYSMTVDPVGRRLFIAGGFNYIVHVYEWE